MLQNKKVVFIHRDQCQS